MIDDTNLNTIVKIISKHTRVSEEMINLNTSTETLDRWDSLSHINIIVDIEKKFNIKIKTTKVSELNSVQSIIKFLK